MVQIHLEKGADVNALDAERRSAPHLAPWRGYGQVVRMLLVQGADVNAFSSRHIALP